jgi:hypothetical protein
LLAARRRGAVLPAALVQSREAAIDFLQRRLVGASKRAIRPPRRRVSCRFVDVLSHIGGVRPSLP